MSRKRFDGIREKNRYNLIIHNKIMNKLKRYNIFIALSSFSKSMIEVFIPLLMYEANISFKMILVFLLIKFLFVALLIPLSSCIGKKINFKNLIILSNIIFIIMNFYLSKISFKISEMLIFTFLYSSYLIFYWIGRHIYAMSIIEEKKTTEFVSSFTIFSLIGALPGAYAGALILKHFGFTVLNIILLVISIVSVLPLSKIKEKASKEKIEIKSIMKKYPLKNYLFLFLEQFKQINIALFPLYLYLAISRKFEYIGVVGVITNISSIIYVYLLAKKMDKNKKDYLGIMCLLLSVLWLFKLNIESSKIMIFIIFLEGIFVFGLETIILRNIYSYGKEYKVLSYNLFIEVIKNIFRVVILFIFIIFDFKLKLILYVGLIMLFISSFIKFDDGKYGYKNIVMSDPTTKQ